VSFAKWRYQTFVDACRSLLKVRLLCTQKITADIFKNTQEKELIKDVLVACKHARLWTWIRAMFDYVLLPLERLRRWGMICDCHKKERETKKHFSCPWNSRRLGGAEERVQKDIQRIRDQADALRPEHVEGDEPLCKDIVGILKAVAAMLVVKFAFLSQLPYKFVHAESVEGAKLCLTLIDKFPFAEHTATTQWWILNLRVDLESRAAGNPASPALVREVKRLKASPLSEDPGEGYHRGTSYEKLRSAASSREHLIALQRRKQNIARGLCLIRTPAGKKVWDYEWKHFKRVLNKPISRRHIFRRVQLQDRPFFKHFYRIDEGVANQVDRGVLKFIPGVYQ